MANTLVQFRTEETSRIKAMKSASHIAAENGIADMTLEDINAEIAEVRK